MKPWAISLPIVLLVILLRLGGISDNSITQDESTMILFARGVIERGYPFLRQVHSEFIISTYELVPYPIALFVALFGTSEFSVRLPSLLFAAGTSLLILRFGTQLFDRRVGVLAALLFAVLPWAIYWGSNAFYPSQVQFFSLLTTMVVHRLVVDERPATWVYYAMLGSFTASYLTWEGSGFLLPVFFVILLAMRWWRFAWLKNPHGWVAASLMIFVVVLQLTYRTVLREPYLGIMTGRSEISMATIAFTSVGYDPFYYAEGLFTEAHLVIGSCLVLGLLFVRTSRPLVFLYLFLGLVILFLTSALGYYALRYIYLALPAALLIASATSVMIVDRLTADSDSVVSRRVRALGLAAVGLLHFSVASPWGLSPTGASPELAKVRPTELGHEHPGFSFRSVADALEEQRRPGDVLIVQAPFPFQVYTGLKGDYFLQTVVAGSIFYQEKSMPFYTDKWVANPVLRDRNDLDEVLHNNERVWLVATPDGASKLSIGDDLYSFFEKNATVVMETEDGRLYLWKRPGSATAALTP